MHTSLLDTFATTSADIILPTVHHRASGYCQRAILPSPSSDITASQRRSCTPLEFTSPGSLSEARLDGFHEQRRLSATHIGGRLSGIQARRLSTSHSERQLSTGHTERRVSSSATERRLSTSERLLSASQSEWRLSASQAERRLSASHSRTLLLDVSRRQRTERAERLRARMAEADHCRRELCQQVLAEWRSWTHASVDSAALAQRRAGIARWQRGVHRRLIRRLARVATRLLRRWKATWRVARRREARDVQLRMAAEFARTSTQRLRGKECLRRWWLAGARTEHARKQMMQAERFASGSALMHTLAVRACLGPYAHT